MSPKTSPDSKSSHVFYLNEDENEFTFYLDATNNQEVFQALAESSGDAAGTNEKSLAPEISFTNVLFKTGTIDKIASKFWRRLRVGGPAFDYLLEKMKRRRPSGRVIYGKVKAAKTLSPGEREQFRQLINKLLSSTAFDDLPSQSWITSKSKSLSKEDEQLLNDLKRHRRSYSEQYKRFLMAAVFPGLFTWKTDRGRALICFSHAGRYLSVTVRKQKQEATGYQADFHKKTEERRKYLFSTGEYCNQLYHEFFETTDPPQPVRGLLVVTGATNSLKSEIARGLIDMYLRNKERGPKERLHHLVTFEDPIEKFYYVEKTEGPARVALVPSKRVRDIDYTPRQKLQDASDLRRALNDALRQTPTVFFVGETRQKEEWPVLLDFAATGHFIVTTAHAGSLVEAMHKIFEACNVRTSGDRAEIASKLLGLIHLRPWNVFLWSRQR